MKQLFSLFTILSVLFYADAQDTFSIVAMDESTGEVGSAGASCVNLSMTSQSTNDFIGELFPGVGAINCQAWYVPSNQNNARTQMNLGHSPDSIISWLIANDVQNNPALRQYGIVAMVDSNVEAAAHTGVNTDDYKGHLTGANYSIQGNILSGAAVLDSMEARFLREDGDLACKLMAAMQGANTVGADSRCSIYGTSSLFSYLKVAQPTDVFGSPSFLVSMRSTPTQSVEPIDSLQALFDLEHLCDSVPVDTTDTIPNGVEQASKLIQLFPNPGNEQINIQSSLHILSVQLTDIDGRIMEAPYHENKLDIFHLAPAVYSLSIRLSDGKMYRERFLKRE